MDETHMYRQRLCGGQVATSNGGELTIVFLLLFLPKKQFFLS
jgi:hypothetical protein